MAIKPANTNITTINILKFVPSEVARDEENTKV